MTTLNENTVEIAALKWLQEIGYQIGHGPEDAAVGKYMKNYPMSCCGCAWKMHSQG